MALGAAGAKGTVAVDVGLTYWAIGRKAVEVGSLEEGREGEGRGVGGRRLGEELSR